MQFAISSGKGGTGKTTVATSLALSLVGPNRVVYLDCDVEAPNGYLFLKPNFTSSTDAVIRIPEIDPAKCSLCGRCVEVCQFHALAKVGKRILVFHQLCHGCGSCTWNCPEGAITEVPNSIGFLEAGGTQEDIRFAQGRLTISEPMPTPVIRQLKRQERPEEQAVVILDSPPGASCSVVETLRGADFALLVTEPTPFGLHDLRQILGIVREMNIPAGVIINRTRDTYEPMEQFCNDQNLLVMMRIPYERRIAEGLAQGKTLLDIDLAYRDAFIALADQAVKLAARDNLSL